MKQARFYYALAGDKLSDMVEGYGFGFPKDESLNQIEDEMDKKPKEETMDHNTSFDDCEREARDAMKDSDVPFAIIFQGSKIYGVITKDLTKTHEVL